MDKRPLVYLLGALAAPLSRRRTGDYSALEYRALVQRGTIDRRHMMILINSVASTKEITVEDILEAAHPDLVFNKEADWWEYSPPAESADDPSRYRAAVCETLAACLAKHYTRTGRSLGYHGAPWQELGIGIARAWFDYDRLKLYKEPKQ